MLGRGEAFGLISRVTTDSRNRLYVFQRKDPAVLVFGPEGNFLHSWGSGQFKRAHGFKIVGDVAYVTMAVPMVISGFGLALAIPAMTKAVVGSVAPGDIGKASGAFSTLRQLGGAFGVAALVAVFSSAGSYTSARAFSAGFVPAIGIAAGLSLAGAVAGLALPRRRPDAAGVPPVGAQARPVPAPARVGS